MPATLPAEPETVATFISNEADGGIKVSTIGRRLAAIRYAHRLAGHRTPTDAEMVAVTMHGILRVIGSVQVKESACHRARCGKVAGAHPLLTASMHVLSALFA